MAEKLVHAETWRRHGFKATILTDSGMTATPAVWPTCVRPIGISSGSRTYRQTFPKHKMEHTEMTGAKSDRRPTIPTSVFKSPSGHNWQLTQTNISTPAILQSKNPCDKIEARHKKESSRAAGTTDMLKTKNDTNGKTTHDNCYHTSATNKLAVWNFMSPKGDRWVTTPGTNAQSSELPATFCVSYFIPHRRLSSTVLFVL